MWAREQQMNRNHSSLYGIENSMLPERSEMHEGTKAGQVLFPSRWKQVSKYPIKNANNSLFFRVNLFPLAE